MKTQNQPKCSHCNDKGYIIIDEPIPPVGRSAADGNYVAALTEMKSRFEECPHGCARMAQSSPPSFLSRLRRVWRSLLTSAVALFAITAPAQVVNYHMGTILGNGSPQGYHVGTVGIGNFNDRLSLRAATFTPWEFGEIWVGFIGEWVVPKSQKFQADLLFSLGIVGRIDGNFQPLKNLRPAVSFGVGF